VRGDTDFSLTENFDRWAELADFVFGMDNIAALRRPADALEEPAWRRLERARACQGDCVTVLDGSLNLFI
jgi:hypothetical protein